MFPETLKRSSKYPPKISKYNIIISCYNYNKYYNFDSKETDISVIVVVFQFHGIFEY